MPEPIHTLTLPQDRETPLQATPGRAFACRYVYARGAAHRAAGQPGHAYLAVREGERSLAFALCNGAADTPEAGLAARFLGNALVAWLWSELPEGGQGEGLAVALADQLRAWAGQAAAATGVRPLLDAQQGGDRQDEDAQRHEAKIPQPARGIELGRGDLGRQVLQPPERAGPAAEQASDQSSKEDQHAHDDKRRGQVRKHADGTTEGRQRASITVKDRGAIAVQAGAEGGQPNRQECGLNPQSVRLQLGENARESGPFSFGDGCHGSFLEAGRSGVRSGRGHHGGGYLAQVGQAAGGFAGSASFFWTGLDACNPSEAGVASWAAAGSDLPPS